MNAAAGNSWSQKDEVNIRMTIEILIVILIILRRAPSPSPNLASTDHRFRK
jgi:hypothetical protein